MLIHEVWVQFISSILRLEVGLSNLLWLSRAVKPVPPKELPDVPVRKQKPKAEAKAAAEVGPLPSSAAAPAVALAAAPAADPAAAAASAKQKGRSAGSSNYNGEDLDGTFYVIICYCLKLPQHCWR